MTGSVNSKREKQTRYLSQAIQLEEAVNPHIVRATMSMVCLALFAFIAWAAFTNINEVARTPGEVVPHGYQKTIQHLEGGMVHHIHVYEGEIVEKDQILLTLSDAGVKDDLERARVKQRDLEMQAERLRAFIEGRQPDFEKFDGAYALIVADQKSFFAGMRNAREKEARIISDQIIQKKQAIRSLTTDFETAQKNLKISRDMYARRQQLNDKGYASDMQLLDDERKVNELEGELSRLDNQMLVAQTEVTEFEARLASLSARHQDESNEKLGQVLLDKAQNAELINKLEERVSRLQVRAPDRGLVKGLSVNTIGGVIQPGQTIMEIVPLDKQLEVSVKISPQDIGHLAVGQDVQVKFSTFDFSRYGSIQGQLSHISATTFTGDDGGRYYQGRVILERDYVGGNPKNIILPGMTVMADVITGRKTILQYMLKPIHVSLKTAFQER